MKAIVLCSMLIFSGWKIIPAQVVSDTEKNDFFLNLCQDYFPDGLEILTSLPGPADYLPYAASPTHEGLIHDFGNVIHEACHKYQHTFGYSFPEQVGYFLGEGIRLQVNKGYAFNSEIMGASIADTVKENLYRFGTYVSDGSGVFAQIGGIYGLLEEMTAYYQEARAKLSTLPYFQSFCPEDDFRCWARNYLNHTEDAFAALHEFRLYIGWYLDYARRENSAVFLDLLANRPLRVTFTLLERQFLDLEARWEEVRATQIQSMNRAGIEVRIDERGFLTRYEAGESYSIGTFLPFIAYIGTLWTPPMEQTLDHFRIAGVNAQNYREFM